MNLVMNCEFVRRMIESFYTFQLYEKSKRRMAEGDFKLRKWLTNNKALRDRTGRVFRPLGCYKSNDCAYENAFSNTLLRETGLGR